MDNNRYFIYRRSEVFFVWANYQKWRQRFSILQQRSVFSSYVVADTGRAVPEATLPGDQLVAGRSGCSRRRKKRAKTVAEERGDPDFFVSLHQRENRISRWPIIFREGSILAPRLPPSPPLPSFVHCEWSIDQKFYHDKNGGKTKENITLIYAIIALGITFRRPTCRPSLCNAIWKKRGYLFSLIEFTPYECNEEEQLKDG